MIKHLSHVAIAVPDLESAAARLESVYGLKVTERHENSDQGVRMAYVHLGGETRLELIEPMDMKSPIARFLERNPKGGLHHLSFSVADLGAALEPLAALDIEPISAPQARNVHGEPIAFLHPRDFLGVLVELETSRENHD